MKKKLALLLCVLMAAMPVMAMAEGEGVYLRISNPQVYEGDELLLELPDVAVEIGAGLSDADASVWAAAQAGDASLIAAGALSAEDIKVSMTGVPAIYKLTLADLGLTEEALGEMLESVEVPEFESFAADFATAIEELQPQLDAAIANATMEENVQWYMYDAEHTTTKVSFTIPSELCRGYFEAGWDMIVGMIGESMTMMQNMGADVGFNKEDLELDMDELFTPDMNIVVDIYQDAAAEEYISLAIYFVDATSSYPVYLDLYMPIDGVGAYLCIPGEDDMDFEVLFENYDDGYAYFEAAVTDRETSEMAFNAVYNAGMDETGDFLVQEFTLTAEDTTISVYDHNDDATEHYMEVVIAADGTEVVFELATAPNGNGATGNAALTAEGATIVVDVEYGFTDAVISEAEAGLDNVDILTMDDDAMEAVGEQAGNALLNFLMQAVEEVPELQMFFGE